MKQRWKIERTSCGCGGSWAWYRHRPSGGWESMGCVCHHFWTLVVLGRLTSPTRAELGHR